MYNLKYLVTLEHKDTSGKSTMVPQGYFLGCFSDKESVNPKSAMSVTVCQRIIGSLVYLQYMPLFNVVSYEYRVNSLPVDSDSSTAAFCPSFNLIDSFDAEEFMKTAQLASSAGKEEVQDVDQEQQKTN